MIASTSSISGAARGVPKAQKESPETLLVPEQLAALAYALWHERGCPEGSPVACVSVRDKDWERMTGKPETIHLAG